MVTVTEKLVSPTIVGFFDRLMPSKGGFLYYFSVETGVFLTTTLLIILVIITISTSISENNEEDAHIAAVEYTLVFGYCAVMFVGMMLVVAGNFLESPKWLTVGFYVSLVAVTVWFGLLVVSLIVTHRVFVYACIGDRCPETHWLIENIWRKHFDPVRQNTSDEYTKPWFAEYEQSDEVVWQVDQRNELGSSSGPIVDKEASSEFDYVYESIDEGAPLISNLGAHCSLTLILGMLLYSFMCYTLFTVYAHINNIKRKSEENQTQRT